jgi:hypothetical protein
MQFNSISSKSTNSTRLNLISMMGFALLALCFSQVPARAQEVEQTRQITIVQDMVVVGLVPGQTLSITLSNPEDSGAPVSGHVKILDAGRGLVFETPEVEIAPGEFHSFQIDRANIALPGDPRTGRFQVAARLTTIRQVNLARSRARIDKLPSTIELIDNATGKTTAMLLPAVQKVREAAN